MTQHQSDYNGRKVLRFYLMEHASKTVSDTLGRRLTFRELLEAHDDNPKDSAIGLRNYLEIFLPAYCNILKSD